MEVLPADLRKDIPIPHLTCSAVTPFSLLLVLELIWFTCPRTVFSVRSCNSIRTWQHPQPTFFCGFWLAHLSPFLVHSYLSRWLCSIFGKHHLSCLLQLMVREDSGNFWICSNHMKSEQENCIIIILITKLVCARVIHHKAVILW